MPNPMFNMIGAFQRANQIMQTIQNPAAFVKQQFPDVPDNILNDPGQVLSYLQRTRNIPTEQIQQLLGSK